MNFDRFIDFCLHEFFLFKSHAIGFAIDYLINYIFYILLISPSANIHSVLFKTFDESCKCNPPLKNL